jgi:hypothetical protein
MMAVRFQSWLEQRYPPGGTAATRFNNCKRVEEAHGDLDEHYDQDRMTSLVKCLKYSTDDKRAGRANPSNIRLDNCDLYNNLAMYRSAINLYREFRRCNGTVSTPRPMLQPIRAASSWPEWVSPSNEDLLQLAEITTPYIRFLHPDIVLAVVEDNEYRRKEWCSRLVEHQINPSLYLWERSACAFPGVRVGGTGANGVIRTEIAQEGSAGPGAG